MARGNLFAQTTGEMTDAKEKNTMENTLREFGRCAMALRNVLDEDKLLDDMELLFIENHFQVIQMAYLRWKRKHRLLP